MRIVITMLLILLIFSLIKAQQGRDVVDSLQSSVKNIKEEMVPIKENYYVIQPYGLAGNIGLFISDDQAVLVDAQWAILAERIMELVRSATNKPVKYVVNTHFHYDHIDGNKYFGQEKVPIISHRNAYTGMSQNRVLSPDSWQKAMPQEALPNITFTEKIYLHEKSDTIELIHFKNAHTDGDVIVHFIKGNIYHTGDIFVRYGLPFIDMNNGGDIYGMIEALDYLIGNANVDTQFIPGHGAVCTVKEVKDFRDLLGSIRDQVANMAKKKTSLDKIIQDVAISIKTSEENKRDFITKVYQMVLKRIEP